MAVWTKNTILKENESHYDGTGWMYPQLFLVVMWTLIQVAIF